MDLLANHLLAELLLESHLFVELLLESHLLVELLLEPLDTHPPSNRLISRSTLGRVLTRESPFNRALARAL